MVKLRGAPNPWDARTSTMFTTAMKSASRFFSFRTASISSSSAACEVAMCAVTARVKDASASSRAKRGRTGWRPQSLRNPMVVCVVAIMVRATFWVGLALVMGIRGKAATWRSRMIASSVVSITPNASFAVKPFVSIVNSFWSPAA
eukprot:7376799-Prymnesium_polylepis.1